MNAPRPRDPETSRRNFGIAIAVVLMVLGLVFELLLIVLPNLTSKHPGVELLAMAIGAALAIPFLLVYVGVPWIVDRYDPEPLWALLLCLAWGAFGAAGFSILINTVFGAIATAVGGKAFGSIVGSCLCAPVVEELTKGMGVFFMFYFVRREFDGVVDGVIYGTFAALGFACVENVLYYSDAASSEMLTNAKGLLAGQILQRGLLKPWGHPLYTAITGLGFGIARETTKRPLKWLAPIGCFSVAVFLHSLWNTSTLFVGRWLLPLFFLLVVAFFVLVLSLVKRKGRIIRAHLRDEVLAGNLTRWELDLVTSPIARLRATLYFGGATGRRFVDVACRLALSKWHTTRASQGRALTVSGGMIFPLRQELHRLRAAISATLGRPLPQPQPWSPPPVYRTPPGRRWT